MSFSEDVYRDQLYTEMQSRILINIPRVSGALSVLGSMTILYIIFKDWKRKLQHVYHRLLLGYSILDVLCSLVYALSSTVVPEGTPGVYGATGSTLTCNVAGFVMHYTLSLGLYGSFLCVYYVLVLRYRVREETIAKYIEPWIHAFAIIYPGCAGILMLQRDMYNPGNINVGWCFVNCYPMDCLRNDDIECERGAAYEGWLLLQIVPFIIFLPCVFGSCLLTLFTVRNLEIRGRRWAFSSHHSRIRVKETTIQALLYVGAIFISHIWFGITGLAGPSPATIEHRDFYFGMGIMTKIFQPLQGAWNFFIYIRPRYNAIKRRQPESSWSEIMSLIVSGTDLTGAGQRNSNLSFQPIRRGRMRVPSLFGVASSRALSSPVPSQRTVIENSENPGEQSGRNSDDDDDGAEDQFTPELYNWTDSTRNIDEMLPPCTETDVVSRDFESDKDARPQRKTVQFVENKTQEISVEDDIDKETDTVEKSS